MNIRALFVAALAALFGFAAQAEDYSLAAGESATLPEGNVTYGKMTIAGDLTVPNLSTAICNNVTISGTMTVDGAGSYIGAANFDASSSSNSKFTFAPGATESDPHGRLVVTNRGMIGLGAITINAGNNQDAEVLDFLELTDGGRMHIRSLTTSSKLPARINVSGTGGSFLASTGYTGAKFFGKVSEGRNKFIINMNNAPFNYYSGASSWNDEGIEVDVVGTGDFSIYDNSNTEAKESDPEKNTEIRFRTGARFRHTGAINVLRPAKGANFCSIRFMVDDVVGENVTGMFVREGGGVDAYVKLSIDEGVTVDLKTLECDTGGSTLVLRDAGTLRLGAAEGASKLGATSFDAESTMTIEKIGANELTVTRDLTIPTLKVTAGSVRFAAAANACQTLLGSGKVIVNEGKTLCVEDLSAFAGCFAPASDDVWARGEYELCYFKGDLPTAATAAISADDQFSFSSEEVAEGTFAGYKVLKLTVAKNVIPLHFTESGEVDLAAAAGGTFSKTCEVEIDPDVTVTNTTALVGPGKLTVLGGGTLVLSAASPDHAAGVYIGNATVTVTTGYALGTGDVTVEGCGANGQISRLWFDVQDADATIPNDITFETETATHAGFVFVYKTAKNIHFTGDIVAKAALSMTYSRVDTKSSSSFSTKRFFFEGAVDVGGALTISGQYGYVFSGSLKADYVYVNADAASPNNIPYAYIATTDVDVGYFMNRKTGRIVATVENCFGNAGFRNNDSAANGGLEISTYDQKLAYLDGTGNTSKPCGIFADAATGATLTLTGGGSDTAVTKKASTRLALTGKLNLVVDQTGTGAYTQTIYGTNTMSGTITVKKGTLNLSSYALFRNVPEITVSGGALNLDSKEPNAFAGLAKLTVSGGAFTVSATTVDALPKDGSLALSLTSGATFSLPSGTSLHVAKLFIDGAQKARSTAFTHDDFDVIPEGVSILADAPIEYVCTESGDIDIAAIMGGADVGCNLTIPAGITVTNTTAIPSTCRQVKVAGGGELVLTEASTAFAGGFYVGDAILRVTAADALGSGDITIVGYKNAGGESAILFDTGSAEVEFSNDIRVLSNNDDASAIRFGWLTGLLTLSGEIVSDGNLYLSTVVPNATQSSERLRLTGSLTTAGEIRFTTRWKVTFYGKVTASRIFAYGSSGDSASTCTPFLHFYHEANEIGYLSVRKAAEFHCQVENCFTGTYFSFGDVSNSGGFELHDFDQTLEYISNTYDSTSKRGYFSASADGATLTLTGDGTAKTVSANNTLLTGGLSLVVDQQGDNDFVQTFADNVGGTAHTMTGSIGVRKGTLNFTGAVTLANVPAINVEGGALNLTTTANGAFAGVKNLAISGGTFTIDGTGADPFGPAASTQTEAAFSGEGKLSLADGVTATVFRACTNGVYLEAGEYTGADSAANALQLPQLSGNGVLRVLKSGPRGMILFVQ